MFYIYENWQAGPHKTVIHEGSCASCNEGTGRAGGYDRRHASWHGPYRTLEDAREAASAVAQAVVKKGGTGKRTQRPLDANSLGTIRRRLFQMLDWAEGKASRDTTPMKRVIILRDQGKIPKNIANLMQTVLGFRKIAEYDDYVQNKKKSDMITSAWEVVLEWHSANSKR